MPLQILTDYLLHDFTKNVVESPLEQVKRLKNKELPAGYFDFYMSESSVYSSKIEGENIDYDSYFKHKFLNIPFKPDYTQKTDDLFAAYEFIEKHPLNFPNVCIAHAILSRNLLSENQQGVLRTNPMYVINSDERIEYVAAKPDIVKTELEKLFEDIGLLLHATLNPYEIFYYAAFSHLVLVKIHPFQDGNGRTARLLEKWFLWEKLGADAMAVQSEKNYFRKIREYYQNLRRLGLEYETLDYSKSLDFLLMTIKGMYGLD